MNIVYLLSSQAITLILGVLKSLIIPMHLSINDFGYWQIYLLYIGYLGILGLGFNDGLLLRYGKYNLKDLPQNKIGGSITLFIFFQIIIMIILLIIISVTQDNTKKILFIIVTINIPLIALNGIFLALFQSTNQIKKYSYFSIIDKLLMMLIIGLLILTDQKNPIILILADSITRCIAIAFMFKEFKSFFLRKQNIFSRKNIKEILYSSKAGSFVLLSNLTSMLLIGYSLFLIEHFMTISEYSKYALGISTTNIFLVFITAISVFIFPNFSRLSPEKLLERIKRIKIIILFSSIFLINFYFIIYFIIIKYLEKYDSILIFLPFIFLSVIVQINYNVLIVPYFKVLRREKLIFKINLLILIINIILMSVSILFFKSLIITSFMMYITFYLRNLILEFFINENKYRNYKMTFLTLFSHILFIMVIYLFYKIEYSAIAYMLFSIIFVSFNLKKVTLALKEK